MKSLYYRIKFAGILVVFGIPFFLVLVLPWLHSFLSRNHPVTAKTLVVQGWIFDTMIDQTVAEINRGNYIRIIVTGSEAAAQSGKARLVERGVDPRIIELAPFVTKKNNHRTFRESHSLKKFLQQRYPDVRSLNIITSAVHGKKTFTIFKKVLGDSMMVGILTCRSNYYNQDWLLCSPLGIKVTLKFFIGYIYGLLWNAETGSAG